MFFGRFTAAIIIAVLHHLTPIHGVCKKRRDGTWAIGLMFGDSPFSLFAPDTKRHPNAPCVKNPILTCADVFDVNASYVADPFLYIDNAKSPWHIFFEVLHFERGKGEIAHAVSRDQVIS